MIRLLPQSGGGWEGVAWQLPKKVKNKKRLRMIPVGVTMDLVLPGLAGKFDRTDPVSRDHPGQKSRHKNSHGYAIRTRGYRGQLKLVFEDLAVERQARILDDDLHRDDFCHFYASLVKLYKRWDWFEQITTLIQ